MKLRNKKTGVIVETYPDRFVINSGEQIMHYNSLAKLNENWEDYEEPKGFWSISADATIEHYDRLNENDRCKEIGNYFDTREEAEQAVEKLKTWKRLKDKGFRFDCWYGGSKDMSFSIPQEIIDRATAKDLDLLFGGEA
jgi:hypothetical protein